MLVDKLYQLLAEPAVKPGDDLALFLNVVC